MISKRSLLLILCLAITGCNMDCVEPGLQSRNTSVNVDVPVHKAGEEVKIHWVDSGQVISKGEEIKFTLDGSVNFCPFKEDKNPRKVLVPASFCADGSEPNYSKAANINDVPNNYGVDEKGVNKNELCGGKGFGSNRRYVDTGIKVNPGDKLSFSLVPRKITIDYDNPGGKGISFDDNCYRAEEGGEKVSESEILNVSKQEGEEFFCEGKDGKRNKIKFLPLDKTKAKESKVLVGNGYTPYDNKVHFNKSYVKNNEPWIHGSLFDLRRAKIGLNELCDGKNCSLDEKKKYSSYELNCYYQNICYTRKGIWSYDSGRAGERNCVSSIRYKKYDKGNKCDMYSYLEKMEGNVKAGSFTEDDKSWAEALVAKIGDLGDQDTDKGMQCLPDNEVGARKDNVCSQISDNFEDFSLKLNSDYAVNDNVKYGSSVMLAIADYGYYGANRGGYHVKVTRSCEYINGEKLYVYLGDNPPGDPSAPKTNDFKKVEHLDKTKDKVYYIIDGGLLTDECKPKKIYFGINVSNVEKDDITDKNGKYYENNKYSVTLFVKRKINDFISSNVNGVFKFIKEEVIGDSVKDSYKGYARGLLQGVRALLTLYVIFTVIGYMLGTIQLSKFDFIVRMFKIAFIAFAFSDRSWELFGTTLSRLFIDGSTYLVDSFSGYIGEGGRKFAFLDLTAGVLFTAETWLKFLSLMLSGPFGFIAFLAILYATFMFLKCIISATFKYVISTVLVAFLLSLTPLFIVFILFQKTKPLFDNWIKTLAHVSLEPVILFSFLSLLNQLMYSVLYNLTNFSACYQCLISVNFLSYDLCLMKSILPLGYSPGTSVDVALSTGERAGGHFAALPIDLIQAFIYLIIAGAMEAFVSISETMVQTLFSSGYGVTGGVGTVAKSASQAMLSTVGLDDKTQSMIQSIKQKMSKDRGKIEAKLPNTPKQPDKKEDSKGSSDKTTSDRPKTLKQSDQQKNSDETIRSDPSAKAKNKEENGEE
ncbi:MULTISPECIES: TrbL/VirB6 family protein [unclassified Wolbachia]|uniref:type IV secretion system protein n=1 Tax=unclassified Wolbachia TaxID=2640676 RepID=UPI0011066B75|nr:MULTISPECIES: type IV secretion system protein [unclassified Wolbachia]MDV6249128.1 type IV secretion system protein [Wolbachia endosymbiont of Zaprionus taronus]QVU15769.1 Type IV secretion system protein VirB6, putative [Wolbachia endosymbiont of Drosophila yakuba]QVU16872.1 Type IV secretion system protein VirB6, putative [Wolbachia endosymbiont of Drosophila santomea]QWE32852.1 Type IV secretion system protein VirB6, putative [Wolbachia endosymbiont of Drosophila simulans]TLW84071.1 typ